MNAVFSAPFLLSSSGLVGHFRTHFLVIFLQVYIRVHGVVLVWHILLTETADSLCLSRWYSLLISRKAKILTYVQKPYNCEVVQYQKLHSIQCNNVCVAQ